MSQKGFFFDSSRCTGCRTCSVACNDAHDTPVGLTRRRVTEYEGGFWTQHADGSWSPYVFAYYMSTGCQNCLDPACVKVCPTGAHYKRSEDGVVVIDEAKCVGCGACAKACPYGAPVLDRKRMKMTKCDSCLSLQRADGIPVCVAACPERALGFGDIDVLRKEHGNVADIAPLPDPSLTKPSLTVKPAAAARKSGDTAGTAHRY